MKRKSACGRREVGLAMDMWLHSLADVDHEAARLYPLTGEFSASSLPLSYLFSLPPDPIVALEPDQRPRPPRSTAPLGITPADSHRRANPAEREYPFPGEKLVAKRGGVVFLAGDDEQILQEHLRFRQNS